MKETFGALRPGWMCCSGRPKVLANSSGSAEESRHRTSDNRQIAGLAGRLGRTANLFERRIDCHSNEWLMWTASWKLYKRNIYREISSQIRGPEGHLIGKRHWDDAVDLPYWKDIQKISRRYPGDIQVVSRWYEGMWLDLGMCRWCGLEV